MNDLRSLPRVSALRYPMVAILFVALLYWVLKPPSIGPVSKALEKAIKVDKRSVVDVSTLTDFNWSHLLLFGPYTERERICKRLQLKALECRWIAPAMVDEGQYFLAFRSSSELVHTEFHTRANGDLYGTDVESEIPRERSKFLVTAQPQSNGTQPWYKLTHE
jgi:hypothetical protein